MRKKEKKNPNKCDIINRKESQVRWVVNIPPRFFFLLFWWVSSLFPHPFPSHSSPALRRNVPELFAFGHDPMLTSGKQLLSCVTPTTPLSLRSPTASKEGREMWEINAASHQKASFIQGKYRIYYIFSHLLGQTFIFFFYILDCLSTFDQNETTTTDLNSFKVLKTEERRHRRQLELRSMFTHALQVKAELWVAVDAIAAPPVAQNVSRLPSHRRQARLRPLP